ncbi:FAD-dependent oxidoreductase [Enterobacteriaceae bacterium YMB-R22]|uniref:NAD(P)/FAD-dependent oxidoreductase n=1 Tax=Tenebrionicola larvae TaxID=2815733 RepID=UPI002012C825|nr:FAD-dependent oxidoreductase [Tenebrionicola larvae]MBV4414483.1 FAD-dependent oxidoreductase [Tenebrionicola larvae]
MDKNIVIIGAGFAGMWSALSAARLAFLHHRHDIKVTVIAPQPALCIRPRLYESNPAALTSPLLPLFAATDIHFISASVTHIDNAAHTLSYSDKNGLDQIQSYDKLILASGSRINRASIAGAEAFAFDIDQAVSADRFDNHLQALGSQPDSVARNTFVVCGGGLTGIELATELPDRAHAALGAGTNVKVIVVDRGSEPGSQFGAEMRQIIAQASDELGVEWRLNSSVEEVRADGVLLSSGEFISSLSVVLAAGVNASSLTTQIDAPRDRRGRLHVDDNLKVEGQDDIYATGDVARAACDDEGRVALMSCQHAIAQGKFAGNNAAAALLGITPLPYRQPGYVTCVDLGAWGAVFTETWEQNVKAVREEGKGIKRSITHELILPPAAEREAAFRQADPLAPFV